MHKFVPQHRSETEPKETLCEFEPSENPGLAKSHFTMKFPHNVATSLPNHAMCAAQMQQNQRIPVHLKINRNVMNNNRHANTAAEIASPLEIKAPSFSEVRSPERLKLPAGIKVNADKVRATQACKGLQTTKCITEIWPNDGVRSLSFERTRDLHRSRTQNYHFLDCNQVTNEEPNLRIRPSDAKTNRATMLVNRELM